ncbi:MAG: isocitrate lyase/PEP mutase family protein [Solirubrobacterales bacterium]|nr:isocitrate lyase/PEP mutase family protein [Solirubrobacterales bacterium]MBV9717131.1 isocitrate lyase/PEP mutase family protein [Solirubrobacterales bacterium]
MSKMSLRDLLRASTECVLAPCVYDSASARAVELVGFKAMMFSSGEFSVATTGLPDYGFSDCGDVEWMVNRITLTSPLPLAVDIEDGFGGPLAVYRTCKRMVRAGASAVQLEDSANPDDAWGPLLSREEYLAKVRAAIEATAGSDCMVIARTNADPATELEEAVTRCAAAYELGAEMTTVVRLSNLSDAAYVAERLPGWKMYPDVSGRHGRAEVTVEEVYPLGFNFMTMHYLLKAAMDGMLEHGRRNFEQEGCLYTADKEDATGLFGESASALFDPDSYMDLEAKFTSQRREYRIGDRVVADFPEQFVHTPLEERF